MDAPAERLPTLTGVAGLDSVTEPVPTRVRSETEVMLMFWALPSPLSVNCNVSVSVVPDSELPATDPATVGLPLHDAPVATEVEASGLVCVASTFPTRSVAWL